MPIVELHSFQIHCDGCNAYGGTWHNQSGTLQEVFKRIVPDGWICTGANTNPLYPLDYHNIYCKTCVEAGKADG